MNGPSAAHTIWITVWLLVGLYLIVAIIVFTALRTLRDIDASPRATLRRRYAAAETDSKKLKRCLGELRKKRHAA